MSATELHPAAVAAPARFRAAFLLLGALILLAVVLYWPSIEGLATLWSHPERRTYQHGYVIAAIVLWGIAFGGAAAQLQTAISAASGENADVANSMLGVAFNLAIFAAGVAGAVVISNFDGSVLPIVMAGLAAVALFIAVAGRRTAFPT